MNIDHPELGGRTPGNIGSPQEQVSLLSAFKEQALVAVLHLGNLVDDEQRLLVAAHLALALGVGHQRFHVLHLVGGQI